MAGLRPGVGDGPPRVATTGVVATGMALVGVVGTKVSPVCGVTSVPVVDTGCGVAGVPPFAMVVCAAAVPLAISAIKSIGFADESGVTNRPVGVIAVAVAAGAVETD